MNFRRDLRVRRPNINYNRNLPWNDANNFVCLVTAQVSVNVETCSIVVEYKTLSSKYTINFDDFDELVVVVEMKVQRSDTDGEVNFVRRKWLVVENFQDVKWWLACIPIITALQPSRRRVSAAWTAQ